jgi:hypothetical protein
MSTFIKIVLSVFTLITFVAAIYFAILGLSIHVPLLFVTGLALAAGFGIFVYADARYWYAKITAKPPVPPATK